MTGTFTPTPAVPTLRWPYSAALVLMLLSAAGLQTRRARPRA